ncbi:hypothetical protein NE237_013284 [Protea cynaroides]|uniref:Uncharacterized protein n=1 Tax=Protea cynaroides TaxID=273540 RepID=A0A9Q0H0P2_9MAGN|nr:hypothetical protein NE237_013284 [Protea cynaroides]
MPRSSASSPPSASLFLLSSLLSHALGFKMFLLFSFFTLWDSKCSKWPEKSDLHFSLRRFDFQKEVSLHDGLQEPFLRRPLKYPLGLSRYLHSPDGNGSRVDYKCFQIFQLEPRRHKREGTYAIKDPPPPPPKLSNSSPPNVPINSEEYQNFLKNRLKLTCAAVALTRASSVKPQDSTQLADGGSQASNTSYTEYGRRTVTVRCHVGELRKNWTLGTT